MQRVLLVLSILIAASVAVAPVVGGAGSCLAVSDVSQYLLFQNVSSFDTDDISVELWYQSTSKNSIDSYALFSYAVPVQFQQGREVWWIVDSKIFQEAQFEGPGLWHHFAATWRRSDGDLKIYINGTLTHSTSMGAGAPPISNGGTIAIAQESDSVGGGFDHIDSFTGQMDELRIWRRVRTPAEIQANVWKQFTAADISANAADLALLANFDDTSNPLQVIDVTGKTNNGIMGEWDPSSSVDTSCPCLASIYRLGALAVDPPVFGVSTAPIAGGAAIPVRVAIEPTIPLTVSLRAVGDASSGAITTRVTSLPTHGALFQTTNTDAMGAEITSIGTVVPSGIVWYSPGATFGAAGDTFQYSAQNNDGTSVGTVSLLLNTLPMAYNHTVVMGEDEEAMVYLRCSDKEGIARAVIKTLPPYGYLYQIPPNTYNVKGSVLSAPPVALESPANTFYYVPSLNTAGTSEFTYYCLDTSGASSSDATVKIEVTEVDDFPVVGGALFMVELNGAGQFLEATYTKSENQLGTAVFWIKPGVPETNGQPLPLFSNNNFAIQLIDSVQNPLVYAVSVSDGTNTMVTVPAFLRNQWQSVIVTFTSPTPSVYFNGTKLALVSSAPVASPTLSGTILIGKHAPTGRYYNGFLEEISLWSTIVPSTDVTKVSRSKVGGIEAGLIAAWNFDEGKGGTTQDIATGYQPSATLLLAHEATSTLPAWRVSDGPAFLDVFTMEDEPVLIKLPATELEGQEMALIITRLPVHGRLFQVFDNGTIGPQITQSYQSWVTLQPVSQWASSVLGFSSFWAPDDSVCRDPPDPSCTTTAYAPWQVLGAPLSRYGDSVNAWCPKYQCYREFTDRNLTTDFLEVGFDEPVYVTQVEYFENYSPGSVTGVYARDSEGQWQPLYKGPPDPSQPAKYRIFRPKLCQVRFKTTAIRSTFDTCMNDGGWEEIDSIRMTGNQDIRPGVVINAERLVLYSPDKDGYGLDPFDTFEFKAIDCPYDPDRESSPAVINLLVIPVDDLPIVNSRELAFNESEGQIRIVLLPIDTLKSIDADSGSELTASIVVLPSVGQLFLDNSQTPIETVPFTVAVDQAIDYKPSADGCGINVDSFQYTVSDAFGTSNTSSVSLTVMCVPGRKIIPPGFFWAIGFVTAALMILTAATAFYLVAHRASVHFKIASPKFLMLMLLGAMMCYYSNYLYMLENNLTSAVCHLRVWILSLGQALLFGPLFAKTFRIWRIFSNKTLKVRVITDKVILAFVAILVGVDVVFLILYSAIESPTAYTVVDDSNPAATQLNCSSNPILLGILIAVKCLIIVFGVFLAITTRKVSAAFNESKVIALSIYNIALIAILVIPILTLVHTTGQSFYFTIQSLAVIEVVTVTITLIFAPKIWGVVKNKQLTLTDTRTGVVRYYTNNNSLAIKQSSKSATMTTEITTNGSKSPSSQKSV